MKFNPLFLSSARHSVSNGQSLAHRASNCVVAAFGNSSPCAASDTKHRWRDTARRTNPRSNDRCDPVSNSLPHNHAHMHRASGPAPVGVAALLASGADVREAVAAYAWGAAPPGANGKHFVVSHQPVCQLPSDRYPAVANPRLAPDGLPIVARFHKVSCP